MREPFEAILALVNGVLAQYRLETAEDYQSISDADLQMMLTIVDGAAGDAITAELNRIVADLDAGTKKLPVKAIREVREHQDLMVPRLIKVLSEATSAASAGVVPQGNAHLFAIFLLTELRAQEAFPVILEAFSLPGELPFDLFGDAVTSTLARILALFVGDHPELLDALIDNRALNDYVRWEAAQSYVYLVRDGRLQRDEAVRRLQQHLRQAMDQGDEEMIGAIICEMVSFAPREALDDITEAYRLGLVDTGLVDFEYVEKSIAEGDAQVRQSLEWCRPTGIEDTIEELQHWGSFMEKPTPKPASLLPPPPVEAVRKPAAPATSPVLSRGQRIGRNDPCHCGSGKKFKKCCFVRA